MSTQAPVTPYTNPHSTNKNQSIMMSLPIRASHLQGLNQMETEGMDELGNTWKILAMKMKKNALTKDSFWP